MLEKKCLKQPKAVCWSPSMAKVVRPVCFKGFRGVLGTGLRRILVLSWSGMGDKLADQLNTRLRDQLDQLSTLRLV